MRSDGQLFDPGPGMSEAGTALSADQKLTIRRRAMLDAGQHPVSKLLLCDVEAATCGNCVHHVVRAYGKAYHKCRLYETAGPATDVRVSWPGCTRWEQDDE